MFETLDEIFEYLTFESEIPSNVYDLHKIRISEKHKLPELLDGFLLPSDRSSLLVSCRASPIGVGTSTCGSRRRGRWGQT